MRKIRAIDRVVSAGLAAGVCVGIVSALAYRTVQEATTIQTNIQIVDQPAVKKTRVVVPKARAAKVAIVSKSKTTKPQSTTKGS